jgi:predicted Kef-type K+ transport protein
MTNSAVYFALAFVVFTAVLGGTIAHRLHRPLIIGYVLGGILIGFLLPRFPIIDVHTLELFAGIEVTLLMIWPGVEFSFLALLKPGYLCKGDFARDQSLSRVVLGAGIHSRPLAPIKSDTLTTCTRHTGYQRLAQQVGLRHCFYSEYRP